MLLSRIMVFGYSQFFVKDSEVTDFAFQWTDSNMEQGFARQDSVVSFRTISDFGKANLRLMLGTYSPEISYDRVIAVPFRLKSDKLQVFGPEESGLIESIIVEPGNYRLVAAQKLLGMIAEIHELQIDLFLKKTECLSKSSEILIRDEKLNPAETLKEFTEIEIV